MKVLVCGGRDFGDYQAVAGALGRIHGGSGIELVVEGGARGADSMFWGARVTDD